MANNRAGLPPTLFGRVVTVFGLAFAACLCIPIMSLFALGGAVGLGAVGWCIGGPLVTGAFTLGGMVAGGVVGLFFFSAVRRWTVRMMSRPLFRYALAACAVVAAAAACFEPNRVLRGWLAGEPFYRGRPARYWAEALRADGQRGRVTSETEVQFAYAAGYASMPILQACARNPDVQVRWPAIYLLGNGDISPEPPLEIFIEALADVAPEVRLQAVLALSRPAGVARSAFPELCSLLRDPDPEIAHYADLTLWDIDAAAARTATGWRKFTAPQGRFSVMVPEEPAREQVPLSRDAAGTVTMFSAWHGATRYTIVVAEYPAETVNATQRFADARAVALAGMGGTLVHERPVESHGRKGREYLDQVGGMFVRSRLFWARPRLYQILVAYSPEFLNPRAADYFLNSFQLEDTKEDVHRQ
jgi:hypothetical protein